ncbi:C6 zinc finger domain protein [Cordyceps fumosorosea ARSEF 2679]|uniref:C6 zinc finger domain protein n=1 Tax=Cordyceps fumosorosea (strain ARSEF 2679) TaxID=1081104 RepID=A0A167MR47_CORFA|nr:C6 zinc finger domain protein [Cordyceps fumosorosea ARSEF 2679]OAA54662.1 C6 zinc finger domain protein [Cordyceps fumosorosea ARSEF 2679]
MVGVPGRSKACNTCLKRKIRCDLAKPYCGNCSKSKRVCGGYARKTAYVFSDNVVLPANAAHDTDGTLTYQGRWKGRTTKKSTKPSPPRTADHNLLIAEVRPRLQWLTDDTSSDTSSPGTTTPPPPLAVPNFLDVQRIPMMPSLWQQLHHVFLHAYMPREGLGAAENAGVVTGNWLLQLRGRPSSLPALQTAVAALATAQLGRDHADAALRAQSAHLYLRSLEHLRAAIAAPVTRLSDDALAACLALGVYELTEKPITSSSSRRRPREEEGGGAAYAKHVAGAMMLLELRGPDAHDTPLAHSLFLGLRRHSVITTLIRRADSFLSDDAWRARPWRVYPKNILDRCLDCVLDLPPLQRLADDMPRGGGGGGVADELVEKCTAVLARLEEWHGAFEAQLVGPPYWSRFSTLGDDGGETPFPVSFAFPTFGTAYLLMTYWSGVMVSHWLLFVAYRSLADDEDDARLRARRQEHREAWVAMARNLCQMTEYLLGDGMGKVSLTVALAVLEGAMAMFRDGTPDWEREKAWVAEMIDRTVGKLGEGEHCGGGVVAAGGVLAI